MNEIIQAFSLIFICACLWFTYYKILRWAVSEKFINSIGSKKVVTSERFRPRHFHEKILNLTNALVHLTYFLVVYYKSKEEIGTPTGHSDANLNFSLKRTRAMTNFEWYYAILLAGYEMCDIIFVWRDPYQFEIPMLVHHFGTIILFTYQLSEITFNTFGGGHIICLTCAFFGSTNIFLNLRYFCIFFGNEVVKTICTVSFIVYFFIVRTCLGGYLTYGMMAYEVLKEYPLLISVALLLGNGMNLIFLVQIYQSVMKLIRKK